MGAVPTPIDPQRLPALKAALDAFAEGDEASQKQLAKLYGVAASRLSTLIKDRFPSFPAGVDREDRSRWYPARAAVASMIQYMEDQARGKKSRGARASAALGVAQETRDTAPATSSELEHLGAAELDRLASFQTKMWRLQKEQEKFVPAEQVTAIARGVHTIINSALMGLVNELDPNGQLPAAQRKIINDRSRAALTKVRDQLGRFLQDTDDASDDASPDRGGSRIGSDLPRRRAPRREKPMGSAA